MQENDSHIHIIDRNNEGKKRKEFGQISPNLELSTNLNECIGRQLLMITRATM